MKIPEPDIPGKCGVPLSTSSRVLMVVFMKIIDGLKYE
jgi:hypothetical protein